MVSPSGAVRYLTAYQFHTCSVLRTMRERFDLGPALTRRDAAAPLLEPAFNRSVPRDDHVELTMPEYRYVRPTKEERAAAERFLTVGGLKEHLTRR